MCYEPRPDADPDTRISPFVNTSQIVRWIESTMDKGMLDLAHNLLHRSVYSWGIGIPLTNANYGSSAGRFLPNRRGDDQRFLLTQIF